MKQPFTIQLVACIGKMQSGKDTLAEHLITFKRFAFADKLKETAYMLGWNGLKDEKGNPIKIYDTKEDLDNYKKYFLSKNYIQFEDFTILADLYFK